MSKNINLKNKKGNKKRLFKIKSSLFNFLTSLSTFEFVIIGILCTALVFATTIVLNRAFNKALINKYKANLQNSTVVCASEYKNFSSLDEAREQGIYNRLNVASALSNSRYRVVNSNLEVLWDTYYIDDGRTLINSNILQIFKKARTISEFNKQTGNIETATPIYNKNNEIIGVLIGNIDQSDVKEILTYINEISFALHLILITFVFVILFIDFYVINRRFNKKLNVVNDIAQGHTDKRLSEKGVYEYRRFAKDFNKILDTASQVDDSRSEFVSNVSHELKTPITSIKVLADSLNTGEDFPIEVYKEFMSDIVSEIDRESKIIEDLLALVRMDKSASALNITAVNMNEMLELVLKRLQPIAKKKNIEVLFESFRPVIAQIDEVKMTRVMTNLVENAIKYNDNNGWVHVSLNADHQYFYVKVEDSGMGIPKESQSKVFDRFYRVDKARSRQTGGTGLGLSIVKSIILMHHGTIKLHSEEDVGTVFTLRVPINYVEQ